MNILRKQARFFLMLAAASWAAGAERSFAQDASTNSPPPAPRRPSIILIEADGLGYGDLGCYGQTLIQTPNLDKLAADGIRFTSYYAGSSDETASQAALMLGQHTGHLGVRGSKPGATLQSDDVTVAKVLNDAGYKTALLGKWGLADAGAPGVPQKLGFQQFFGFLTSLEAQEDFPSFIWRYEPPSPVFKGFDDRMMFPQNGGLQTGAFFPDLCTKAAENFLNTSKPDQFNKYRPFFLFVSYSIPRANSEDRGRVSSGKPVPGVAAYENEPWSASEKNRAAMIGQLDANVGRIMTKLETLKIQTNTVVFFTSSAGPRVDAAKDKFLNSAGALRNSGPALPEGRLRVPMIVKWPAFVKPGQVSDFLWGHWDFLPTAAAIGMTKAPAAIDGFSTLPVLTGQPQTNRHEFLYWESHEQGFQQAARSGDWKVVRPQADKSLELYNLKADLGEKTDIAGQQPALLARFEKFLQTARTESAAWPIQKAAATSGGTAAGKP